MKNIALSLMATAMLVGSSGSALAQDVIDNYGGVVTLQKGDGPILECEVGVSLNYTTNKASLAIIPLDDEDPCRTIIITSNLHNFSDISSVVTISAVYANTTITPGDCFGNLVLAKGSGTLTASSATLPQVSSGGSCVINGTVF